MHTVTIKLTLIIVNEIIRVSGVTQGDGELVCSNIRLCVGDRESTAIW